MAHALRSSSLSESSPVWKISNLNPLELSL